MRDKPNSSGNSPDQPAASPQPVEKKESLLHGNSDGEPDKAAPAAPPRLPEGLPPPRWLLSILDHLWVIALPLFIGAFVFVILVSNRYDLSALPWPGLARALLAGILVGAVLGVPYLVFRQPIDRAREELLLRHDAELAVKEARRRLKKHGAAIKASSRALVETATSAVEKTLQNHVPSERVSEALSELEKELEAHLSSARKGSAREYSESIGIAVLIALLLRAFGVEAFKIPSGSMIPTLQVGDHIFVKKFIYGARIPWTDIKLFPHLREPRRGEIIVFVFPNDPEKDYIKRIVGIPGDTIDICGEQVRINGAPLRREKESGACEYEDFDEDSTNPTWKHQTCSAYREWNGNESYVIVQAFRQEPPPLRECRSFLVPHDSVFVMGDNRDNSYDSRFWPFGAYVPYRLIKGKAWFIWWSTGERAVVRLGRMFSSIHKPVP